MFDEDPGSLSKGQPPTVMRYIRAWRPLFTYKEFFPLLEQYGIYLPGNPGKNFRLVEEWKTHAVNLIRNIRSKGTKTPFLRYALVEEDTHLGRPLTHAELAEDSMGGMFGGTGTTANTFLYLLWGVLRQPHIGGKLREELKQCTSGQAGDVIPSYTVLSQLPYLQACLSETLRLYPTIIATLPRTALRDTTVCGIDVPKGTVVGTQNHTIHGNHEAFPDPEAFVPERWIDEAGRPRDDDTMETAFVPFSVGSRKCIGINLAMMELVKVTAAYFLSFKDASVDPSAIAENMEMFDCFSASPRGAKLVLTMPE